MNKRLHVGNLEYSTTNEELEELFASEGNVISAKVIRRLDGKSKGFGYVEMETEDEATKAIEKLNQSEFDIIKSHPKVSYDILEMIEFPWPVNKAILQHHERLDGSGYPNGLLEDDIILDAKILGVADVVEAMSSHRPYRPALGLNSALEEIVAERGILYEPAVVDACLRLFQENELGFERIVETASISNGIAK